MVCLLAAFVGCVAVAQDEEDSEKTSSKNSSKKEVPAVVAALKKAKLVHGKVNASAKCFVYLQSASWCGPCRKEMPEIVAEYKNMKKAGVEVILCGHDDGKKGVKGYVKEFKMPFPAVVAKDLKLPGFSQASGIPHATFVDKNGKVLADGHGSITLQWQKYVPEEESTDEE